MTCKSGRWMRAACCGWRARITLAKAAAKDITINADACPVGLMIDGG